jgi:GH15 family glucan-1,4-alpha-glucosidase
MDGYHFSDYKPNTTFSKKMIPQNLKELSRNFISFFNDNEFALEIIETNANGYWLIDIYLEKGESLQLLLDLDNFISLCDCLKKCIEHYRSYLNNILDMPGMMQIAASKIKTTLSNSGGIYLSIDHSLVDDLGNPYISFIFNPDLHDPHTQRLKLHSDLIESMEIFNKLALIYNEYNKNN